MRTSSYILLSSMIILAALAVGVAAQSAPQSGCNCNRAKTVLPEDKLVNAVGIMQGFEEGNEKVKVIINLTRPEQILKTVNWQSKNSLEQLHGEIRARQERTLATLEPSGFKLRHKFENQAAFSAEVTLDCLNKLMDDANVVSIEPVYVLEKHLAQGIPLINGIVYRSTYNGQGVAIAICDTGVDYTHPMLGGGGFPNNKVIGGYDFGDSDSNPFPIEAHGTCCAGIAAGNLGSVGDYIGGVAYGAKIYALKVENSAGIIYNDSVIAAWNWCVSHKNDNLENPILVISNSLGSGRYYSACDGSDSTTATAANNAVAAGITVLASSGNDGYCDSIATPACLSNVISVGAVYDAAFGTFLPCINVGSCATKYHTTGCSTGWYASDTSAADKVTSYSNTASFLNVLAPSNQAYTTDIAGSAGYSTGDYYSEFGGTSAASPYAAGAVACLQSAAKVITGNYLSPAQVKSILISTGNNVTDAKVSITKPRINLGNAIEALEPNSNPCTDIDITIGTGTSNWDYPMHTANHDARTQVIYLASEIGKSGVIKGLYLYVATVPDRTMNNWTIRMKHTTLSTYGSCALDSTGWTTVYQANEPQGSTGWRLFTFSVPFEYNGTDNLLVDFSYNNSKSRSSGQCKCSTPGGNRSVYANSNSVYGDPLNWTGTTSPSTACSTNVPNIRLTICLPPPNAPILHAEPNITSGLCNTIFWDTVTDANQYYAQCSADSNFSVIDSNSGWIADANYQFCGLVSGQIYFYRVKARSQYLLQSGWSNVVSSRQCSIPSEPNAPFLHAEPNITSGLCNTIFWDTVTDANQYYAECSADSNFSVIDSNSGWIADANYQFCGLVSGQTYFYRVKARSQYLLESGWSNIVSSRQCSIPSEPNAPFLHAEPNITSGLCNTIFWDTVTDANQYCAECSADSNFSVIDSNSGWIADANYQFCGLVSGQIYFYRVKARSQYLLESGWSNVVSSRQCSIPGDFEPDCDVDFNDLMIIADQWLQSPGTPSADIAPPPSGDGIVNFLDFAELANHWLEGVQ